MPFEKFIDVEKNIPPQAYLTAAGLWRFNAGAIKRFHLDAYSHTVMYFDRGSHRIGFELVIDDDQIGANRLRHISRGGIDVDIRAFLKHYQLQKPIDQVFQIGQDPETGWLFARYDDGVRVNDRRRPNSPMRGRGDGLVLTPVAVSVRPAEERAAAVSVASSGGPPRGVKAMISELLKD